MCSRSKAICRLTLSKKPRSIHASDSTLQAPRSVTPRQYAHDVARTLPNALHVVIADAGHSTLSDFEACQTRLAVTFLDDPGAAHAEAARADACSKGSGPRFATRLEDVLAALAK